jgi:hypothetical protein
MHNQLYSEEGQLQSYGWVDQDAGQARIPVSRAMELIAERGLPVRSVAAPLVTPAPGAPVAAPNGKTKKAGQ